MNHYTCMFNAKELSPFAYRDLQQINPAFPHIEDEGFWEKLNAVFIENYNMDLEKLEEYLTQGVEGEPFRRSGIFEFIKRYL